MLRKISIAFLLIMAFSSKSFTKEVTVEEVFTNLNKLYYYSEVIAYVNYHIVNSNHQIPENLGTPSDYKAETLSILSETNLNSLSMIPFFFTYGSILESLEKKHSEEIANKYYEPISQQDLNQTTAKMREDMKTSMEIFLHSLSDRIDGEGIREEDFAKFDKLVDNIYLSPQEKRDIFKQILKVR